MYVQQIMTRQVDAVAADLKLRDAAQLMRDKGRRFLPVIDSDQRLIGLLSHRELERAEPSAITTLSVGEVNYLMAKVSVADVMHKDVISCGPQTLVEEAGQLMREKGIGSLPVVVDGRLVGIVTDDDILDFLLAITGCNLKDTTRIAVHLQDRTGELGTLLKTINNLGGYIATVVSPTLPDETGMRVAIIRYRADNPSELDDRLRKQGYDLVTEVFPDKP